MDETGRGAYRVFVRNPELRTLFARSRCRWQGNVQMNLQEVKWVGKNWVDLDQDWARWHSRQTCWA